MRLGKSIAFVACLALAFALGWFFASRPHTSAHAQGKQSEVKGWTKGKGWGPWGKDDEVGSLNAMTPATIKKAIDLIKEGKVYDLGVPYDRESFKWPGHSPGEILTFRGPEGVRRQGDFKPAADPKLNPNKIGWHSCALFINDNVATQIDSLGHITEGDDNHWYNGFKEADWGGNFGIRKCDATTIPPIITRGVLIDVAGFLKVDALPSNYKITADKLQEVLAHQKTKLHVGDTVMIRTGTTRYWGKNGSDHKKLGQHDSAGIDLGAAKWLVEQQGAILIGSDTSGLEYAPAADEPPSFIPVHRYLLVQQGVHIGEFHNLEELAKDGVYEFCYMCTTNKIRGTAAGFCLRPIAIR
jgi:kynurenine formamidase